MKILIGVMRLTQAIILLWAGLDCAAQPSAGADTNASILWAGLPCELSLGEVSDKTAQLVIAPLDDQGQPRPIPPSAAFVSFPVKEMFRGRDLAGVKEIQVGAMHFVIKARPLTISVHRADGSLLQEFVLEDVTNGAMSFHTDAPVYGLGEGEHQFGSVRWHQLRRMINGQHGFPGLLATHEATIPVPSFP